MHKTDIIGSLLLIAIFAAAYAGAAEFPYEVALYPKLSCALGIFFGVVLILKSYMAMKKSSSPEGTAFSFRTLAVVVVTLLGSVAYVICLERIGYAVTTAIFLMVFSYLFDPCSKKWQYPVVGVAVTAVIYMLFSVALHIPLPKGVLF